MPIDEPVKRQYRSTRRAESARTTRRVVVDAARELFVRDGYPSTTLTAIAERAGVSVQTIYAQFTNKSGLLKEVIDQTVAGDDEPVAISDREEAQALFAEPDPYRMFEQGAPLTRRIHERVAALNRVIQSAASVDDDAATEHERGIEQRHRSAAQIIGAAAARGHLRDGLTEAEATDRIAALFDPNLYDLTVVRHGWSAEQYDAFLTDLMIAAVLPPRPARPIPPGRATARVSRRTGRAAGT